MRALLRGNPCFALVALSLIAALAGCTKGGSTAAVAQAMPDPADPLPGHGDTPIDTARKEDPRLLPAEVYVRSYLSIFGALAPLEAQRAIQQTGGGLFDAWTDYLGALGFPDWRVDLPRNPQTNALMVATFERTGIGLCDAALVRDSKIADVTQRAVFNFDLPVDAKPSTLTQAQFAARFDSLHRLFLGYPASLAPTDRVFRFYQLYQATVNGHGTTAFKPYQAGWAAVCYGLVRHPEFHFY